MSKALGNMTIKELVAWRSYDNCYGCPMGEPGEYGGIACTLKGLHPCEVTQEMLNKKIDMTEESK